MVHSPASNVATSEGNVTVQSTTAEVTGEQIAFYETFGFLVRRQLFDPAETAAITREFDRLMDEDRRGEPFPGKSRHGVWGFAEKSPFLTQLVEDDRIFNTVERLLGPGFSWLCSEGNLYVGNTSWHPDRSFISYPHMKVSFYLDPLTRDDGCLRVIPGSHREPLHEALKPQAAKRPETTAPPFGVEGPDLPAYPLECRPGDVFFLNMNTWHAAYGGAPGRRHMALNFVPEPTNAEHEAAMRDIHKLVLRLMSEMQYQPPGRVFTDEFLQSDRPHIRAITAKWREIGLP